MKIYELKSEIAIAEQMLDQWAIDHEGDITDFPLEKEIERLELRLDERALGLADWVKNLFAEAEAIKAEERNLMSRRRATENKAERIKSYLASIVPAGRKLKSDHTQIGWRKSTVLNFNDAFDINEIPDEFKKVEVTPKKKELKEAVKFGTKIKGVELIEKQNIQIK